MIYKICINKTLTNLLFSETEGIDIVGRGSITPVGCNRTGKNDLRSVATYKETDRLHRETLQYSLSDTLMYSLVQERVANDQYIYTVLFPVGMSVNRKKEYRVL
jgi:hypothetical protein